MSHQQQNLSSSSALSEKWINAIFEEFHGRFGNTFFSKFQTGIMDKNGNDTGIENAKKVWAKRLGDCSPEELAVGVNTEYSYPPDLDSFKKACKPSLDYESAFHEAIQQMHLRDDGEDNWSNPAIYWAAVAMGGDLMSMTYAQIKKRWESALDKAVDDVKKGICDTIIPKRPKLLNKPVAKKKELTEVAKRELAKCYEILNTEPKWKRDLKSKGRTIDENIPGLKHASQHANMEFSK